MSRPCRPKQRTNATFQNMKRILLTCCCLLMAATSSFSQPATPAGEGYPAHLWGIPWPATPDASEYADFDFDQVVGKYPGSAWLMQGNRYFYGVGGATQDFDKAFECFAKAAEYYDIEVPVDTVVADTGIAAGPEAPEEPADDPSLDEEPNIDGGGEWQGTDPDQESAPAPFGDDFTLANGTTIWLAPASYLNYALSLCYAFGLGTAPDAAKAALWGTEGDPEAWLIAGIARYRSGAYDEAWELFEATAEETDFGRIWLAECKLRGHGTAQKEKEALRELEAVLAHSESAQNADLLAAVYTRLGECYRDGLGTRRDEEKADDCLRKAGNMLGISHSESFRKAAR